MRLIDADALSKKLFVTTIFIKDGAVFQRMINDAPTIDAVEVDGYIEWLEKIVVDAEPVWICEDTPCPDWCNENCSYASIQAECLRHIYGERREP